MHLSTSVAIAILLAAPVLTAPVHTSNAQIDDLKARDPGWGNWFKDVKKYAGPAAKVASLVIRDGESGSVLSARDVDIADLEDLAAREPGFGSWFKKIKKFVNGNNIKKAASVASLIVREDGEIFDGVERDVVDGLMALDELD